ncbi:MAG: integrase core domain-containing protein, partial [Pseudonocardia sp.]|nr:integrase core domain-containing protein [Pseudonocardia sp.]
MDASVKAGICELVEHASGHGWSGRAACRVLEVEDLRVARWQARRAAGESLDDAASGGNPVHGLLEWERDAIVELFEAWGETDRSHRKLAHRGSRIGAVHVAPSTLQRVLLAKQLVLPGNPPREPIPRKPWPDWLEWKPNRIWGYDFTHFPRADRAVIAIIDVVSRKWITTVCSAEESSTQVEIAFTRALDAEDLWHAADAAATAELVKALVDGDAEVIDKAVADGDRPLLLAISDNGPQMRSHSTKEFLAGVAIARQFGRPGVPQDQAWIETLFGHVKGEWPHLEHIRDGAELDAELDRVQDHYNTVRLSAAVGYVTPCDEHEGRGEAIRQARRDGLDDARAAR